MTADDHRHILKQQKPQLYISGTGVTLNNEHMQAAVASIQIEIEQGLTSHQTHYRSYQGRVFTGQITQPTVSKH